MSWRCIIVALLAEGKWSVRGQTTVKRGTKITKKAAAWGCTGWLGGVYLWGVLGDGVGNSGHSQFKVADFGQLRAGQGEKLFSIFIFLLSLILFMRVSRKFSSRTRIAENNKIHVQGKRSKKWLIKFKNKFNEWGSVINVIGLTFTFASLIYAGMSYNTAVTAIKKSDTSSAHQDTVYRKMLGLLDSQRIALRNTVASLHTINLVSESQLSISSQILAREKEQTNATKGIFTDHPKFQLAISAHGVTSNMHLETGRYTEEGSLEFTEVTDTTKPIFLTGIPYPLHPHPLHPNQVGRDIDPYTSVELVLRVRNEGNATAFKPTLSLIPSSFNPAQRNGRFEISCSELGVQTHPKEEMKPLEDLPIYRKTGISRLFHFRVRIYGGIGITITININANNSSGLTSKTVRILAFKQN